MNLFKWNVTKNHIGDFWDGGDEKIIKNHFSTQSDRKLLLYPAGYEHRLVLEALCRVVSELVEIAELEEHKRNK